MPKQKKSSKKKAPVLRKRGAAKKSVKSSRQDATRRSRTQRAVLKLLEHLRKSIEALDHKDPVPDYMVPWILGQQAEATAKSMIADGADPRKVRVVVFDRSVHEEFEKRGAN